MKQRHLPILLFLSVVLNAHFLLRFCLVFDSPTFTNYEPRQDFPIRNAGTLDPEGKLILMTDGGERGVPVLLDHYGSSDTSPPNYGFMIVNDAETVSGRYTPNRVARYVLGNREEQSVLFTGKYEVFDKALRTIPVGSKIYECDRTCAADFYYGLHPQLLEKTRKNVLQIGLKLRPGKVFCGCRAN